MVKYNGLANETAKFVVKEQLSDPALWAKFVDIFRTHPDSSNLGWRGEYWGKMMRGAVMVYSYTGDAELYKIITASVEDMMTAEEEGGRVSSCSVETEFVNWDLWCRKYVILACEYYLDICKDEALKERIVGFISRAADYIIDHIGADKKKITDASRCWFGVNSSSILEPIVRLYKLTGNKRYLDFALYIVDEGGAKGINIFKLAYENKLFPYQYGVSKAYEMMSCFEGLLELYHVTGNEEYRISVENFGRAVLKSEVSIIGCSGMTHELFDHTSHRQTVYYHGVMQETCVTVTWMKLCSKLLELTGDSVFADEIERSFYNAYLGAVNTEHCVNLHTDEKLMEKGAIETYLPFDSYSPLIPGIRGKKIGGLQMLDDKTYYGCCACIGSAGVAVFLNNAVLFDDDSVTVNFFENGYAEGRVKGVAVRVEMETEYPLNGKILLRVIAETPVNFTLKIRNPGWDNGPKGYSYRNEEWHNSTVELNFAMPITLHFPKKWDKDVVYNDMSQRPGGYYAAIAREVEHQDAEDKFYAVTRGPITFAADSRTGKAADTPFPITDQWQICGGEICENVPCNLKLKYITENGEEIYLVDYASAGKDWKTVIAAWLPTE